MQSLVQTCRNSRRTLERRGKTSFLFDGEVGDGGDSLRNMFTLVVKHVGSRIGPESTDSYNE